MLTLQTQAERVLQDCIKRAPEHAGTLRRIKFEFHHSLIYGSVGHALVDARTVCIATSYFEDGKNKDEFHDVIRHEIAHILSPPYRPLGRRNRVLHGPEWEAMAIRLGGSGRRTSNVIVAPMIAVPCAKCKKDTPISKYQYARYKKGIAYFHGKCP